MCVPLVILTFALSLAGNVLIELKYKEGYKVRLASIVLCVVLVLNLVFKYLN